MSELEYINRFPACLSYKDNQVILKFKEDKKSIEMSKIISEFYVAADKPCGEAVQTLTQKHVVKRYIIAQKVVPLHYASE